MKYLTFAVLSLSLSASAATRTVTLATDAKEPTAGMLRYELANAADGDTIVFDESLAGATINLISCATAGGDASLVISNKNLTIEGPADGVTLDGGWSGASKADNGTRILFVDNTASETVAIKNVTFANGHGRYWGDYGSDRFAGYYQSGAICSYGPLALTNCVFRKNGTGDYARDGVYAQKGGGAIYVTGDLSIAGCTFVTNAILDGSSSYGGAILQKTGSCRIANSKFIGNYSNSFGGGALTLGDGVTDTHITGCVFTGSRAASANSVHGGVIYIATTGNFTAENCIFRDNGGVADQGGVIQRNAACRLVAANCEFVNSYSGFGGFYWGCNGTAASVFVNCTFRDGTAGNWGSAIESSGPLYLVNCTIVGNIELSNSGAIYNGYSRYLLNTVLAYNYNNASGMPTADMYQSPNQKLRSLCDGTSTAPFGTSYNIVTDLSDIASATNLFAAYEMKSTYSGYNLAQGSLKSSVVIPSFAETDGTLQSSRVIGINKASVLNGTGYPVKANADYTYIAYSTDDGTTWTKLFGTDDGTATKITTDQRGVAYYKGKTPIGAATYVSTEPPKGMMILYR